MKRNRLVFVILALILASTIFISCPNPDSTTEPDGEEKNDPPQAPDHPYPVTQSTEQSTRPIFSWRCEDPESDPLTFTIHLVRYFDSYEHDPIVTTDKTYSMTQDLEKDRRYYWYVEANDHNNDPASSTTWTFYTGETTNNPPWLPYNPDPADYSTDTQAENVTLSWNGYDPDGDPLAYDVWLEVNNGAGEFVVENHSDDFYNVGRLGTSVDFRWYVIAKDDQGGITQGVEWRFETEETNDPPNAPSIPYPDDDEPDAPLDASLSWFCDDPNGDPLVYDVWFGPPLSMMLISEGQSGRSITISGLLRNVEYEWRIVARDDEGAETDGPFWSFTMANEVFAELQTLRSISNDYGILIYSDMIKARFDAAYAPDVGINPLQPGGVLANAYPLYWLDYEQIYFYMDPQGDPIIWPGSTYAFDVTAGGGVDQDLEQDVPMPECEAYFTSPEINTSVSLNNGFEVQWTSSCPGTGTVDIYVRNDMGQDIGIHVSTANDGSYTFSPGELAAATGSYQIFVDLIAEEEGYITAPGYNWRSVWRSRISCILMLYTF